MSALPRNSKGYKGLDEGKRGGIARGPGEKSTSKAGIFQKHPHGVIEKHPHDGLEKHPDIIPRGEGGEGVSGPCTESELTKLLTRYGQAEWDTRTRRGGLLALQDLMLRSSVKGRVAISLECSHQYVSPFKRAKSPSTIREPLAVLCKIGIWTKVQAAVNCHVKNSAIYRLSNEYANRRVRLSIDSPPGQKRRLAAADERREKRLNRRYPWRAKLIQDQAKLEFRPEALREVSRLLSTTKADSTKRALKAVSEGQHKTPFVTVTGTIWGSLNGSPKELKWMFAIGGQRLVECDISHAHHCFLPVLLRMRMDYWLGDETRADAVERGQHELDALEAFLNTGDYYEKWCDNPVDSDQRAQVKKVATQLLNMRNEAVRGIPLYLKMKKTFPLTFNVVENLKKNEHRTMSKILQRLAANAIEAALLRVQALNIPVIPDTDALHVPESQRETVCQIIGEEMFKATGGVCCKVDGIRYAPPDSADPF